MSDQDDNETDKETEGPVKKIDAKVVRTYVEDRMGLKLKVRMFYDLQRMRLQAGGRTNRQSDKGPIQLHERDKEILLNRAKELHVAEKNALADVSAHLKTIPFYTDILSDKSRFKGVGPTMAGVILSEFDIEREDTPSKMWAFAGLRPMPARRCKKCHAVVVGDADDAFVYVHVTARRKVGAVDVPEEAPKAACPKNVSVNDTYESGQAQRPQAGQKLPYNAFLRTKLVGVLGPVLLKVGSPWKKFYDNYKHRKASAGWGKSDAHRHQAAIRYMVKMLLAEIWRDWRAFRNLPVRPSYQEQYLGHVHGAGAAHESSPDSPTQAEIDAAVEDAEAVT